MSKIEIKDVSPLVIFLTFPLWDNLIVLAVVWIAFARWQGETGLTVQEFIPSKKITAPVILLCVLIGLLWKNQCLHLGYVFEGQGYFDIPIRGFKLKEFLAYALFHALLPGFAEELFFRVLLFRTYKRMGFWWGVVLSALLFYSRHLAPAALWGLLLGIILALIIEWTGSYLAVVLIHTCINLSSHLAWVGWYAKAHVAYFTFLTAGEGVFVHIKLIISDLLVAFALLLCIYAIYRLSTKEKENPVIVKEPVESEPKNIRTLGPIIGCIAFNLAYGFIRPIIFG